LIVLPGYLSRKEPSSLECIDIRGQPSRRLSAVGDVPAIGRLTTVVDCKTKNLFIGTRVFMDRPLHQYIQFVVQGTTVVPSRGKARLNHRMAPRAWCDLLHLPMQARQQTVQ
jgi:hypothetical protein